ncbi:MAG: hypothetical protein EZS28_035977, partial [Streblomastix strix]
TGRLKLFGLHFDNLNPYSTVTNPLIQISESYDRQNPQVTIKDFDIVNSEFKNIHQDTNNQQGGAVISGHQDSGALLRIRDQCKFNNITSTGQGGAIYCTGRYPIIEINRVSFIQCKGISGGAIFASSQDILSLTIDNQSEFKQCEIIGDNENQGGGAIYFILSNPGGAIHSIFNYGEFLIESSQFESCNSANSDGGSVFAQIYYNSLSINKVTFIGSSCSQPGSGGAIAIVQQNSYNRISITESSFTNCKTLPGSSSQYGWGGAIDIEMGFEASFLTLENFQLTDLSFTNCKASGAGNNLHILSMDTYSTGQVIKNENLLTVKDQSNPPNIIYDLFTSPQYAYDYMGINESIEKDNPGTIDLDHHNPLFEQLFISNVPNPSYIDAINGKDIKFCGGQYQMCKTIKYSTERNPTPLSGIIPTDSTYSIILTSNTALDTNIQIISTTLVNGHIVIQSDEYDSIEDYTKQSIITSSFSSSLFTISGTGHLELLRLHFDNLNPTSNNPLISISTDSDDVPQLQIKDCEFKQNPDSYSTFSLSHSIISINGGIIKIEKAKIESYKLINENSIITIKSQSFSYGRYRKNEIKIYQSTFSNIQKLGDGNGAAINAELQQDSILKVTDSCTFYNCSTELIDNCAGGAISTVLDIMKRDYVFEDVCIYRLIQSVPSGVYSLDWIWKSFPIGV